MNMRSITSWYVLLTLVSLASSPLALAQSPGTAASEEEVAQLRREIAELKAQIQQLQQVQAAKAPAAAAPAAAAGAAAPAQAPPSQAQVDKLQKQVDTLQAKAQAQPTAGWNGEHFYLRSSDGNFNLMPTGYVTAQYGVYGNEYGAPPDSFSITRARFGFEGNYGKQLDFVLNIETISSPTVRDAYMDFKPESWFKVMAGQMKVPFSLEVGTADTAVDFANRSILGVLYPDASGSNRAPGVTVHGDFASQAIEYWVGAFNGQGILTSGTTNESELVARLRFSPWRHSDIDALKGLAFGGSYEHSRSKGLAGEMSFAPGLIDNIYQFFPQFHINGNVNRYNFFASWLDGPLGLRGEYAHLQQDRDQIGSLAVGGIGYLSQPPVTGAGYYVSAIYFLTGETDPLNALPRVKHPVIGPASPGESGEPGWGAWAVKFRYSHLTGNAPGSTCDPTTIPACPITPVINPPYNDTTDQFSFGVNWYLNYWVLLKTDVDIDRLKDPSVQGINPRNYTVFFETLQFRF
jgi:phosphate-selective porin